VSGLRVGTGGYALPEEFIVEASAILARRGAGKSYAARVIAEEVLAAGQQLVTIDPKGDWWGLRSSADGGGEGYPVVVFGGEHADVPLQETVGALIADVVVDHNGSVILDLSDLSKAGARRFVGDFLERLYWRKRTRDRQTPLLVVIDEADAFIHQRIPKGGERCYGAVDTLVRRGRGRGLGTLLVSQRPAVIAKDVLTQVSVLAVMRTGGRPDIQAIDAWVQAHGDVEDAAVMRASLPTLATGEVWLWGPYLLGGLHRVMVRQARTFDSSATPVPGQFRAVPSRMTQVDLDKLGEQIRASVEAAKAADPKALRARVAELEAAAARAVPVVERVEVPVLDAAAAAAVREAGIALQTGLGQMQEQIEASLGAAIAAIAQLLAPLDRLQAEVTEAGERARPRQRGRVEALPRVPSPARPPAAAPAPAGDGPVVKAGARRILETLARHHPTRMTRAQLGTLAKFKVTGGTFTTYWGVLKRAGYVEESGGDVGITPAGLDFVGVVPAEPLSTEQVLDMWRGALKAGARRMLDVLVDAYPEQVEREALAAAVEMTATGGTFTTYLGTLRRNGLVEVTGSRVQAADALLMGPR